MKSYKKLVALSLIFSMALSIVGCSGKNESDNTDVSESASVSTSEVQTSEPETTIVETEESTSATTTEEIKAELSEETEETEATVETTESTTSAPYKQPDDKLNETQRNSINMLNYMSTLTQKVNVDKKNQLALESVYNSFDNLYPNSVDRTTQAQISSLMDTIQEYRMVSVKRERLQYIYEQNQAQAFRAAIPNPIGLLSAVQSGNKYQIAAAVVYMVADSATSYMAAKSQTDLDFLKDGWELDDAESAELHNSTKNALNYMIDMVRSYNIPGDYALSKSAIEDFVSWSGKPDSQLERKISWLEDNQRTYSAFGPYWLELAQDYYKAGKYKNCLDAVHSYEAISSRIFRKDKDYANVLPMAIVAAKETLSEAEYVKLASNYCSVIHNNTQDKDWSLRYFSVLIYMDLYSITKDKTYIDEAYKNARENVNYLVDEQKRLNSEYLSDVKEVKADKDATKRAKKEIKQYNKTIKAERKIALPPVSEALYLNAEVLFGLAKEKNISSSDKQRIDNILHENGESIFLTKALDDRFWFNKSSSSLKAEDVNVEFDGAKLVIPASCITDRSKIRVTISGPNGTKTFEDWEVSVVKRPKNSKDCSEYMVTIKIKDADKYKYQAGETISVKVYPVEDNLNEYLDFKFNVVENKVALVIKGIKIERVTK